MRSLLIIAHGSRRETSNQEIHTLADLVRALPGLPFNDVQAAFLEIAEPSIPAGLEACRQRGAKNIVVFPYFLAAGRHVQDDIPLEVASFASNHPEITVDISPHLGCSPSIPELIVQLSNLKP